MGHKIGGGVRRGGALEETRHLRFHGLA